MWFILELPTSPSNNSDHIFRLGMMPIFLAPPPSLWWTIGRSHVTLDLISRSSFFLFLGNPQFYGQLERDMGTIWGNQFAYAIYGGWWQCGACSAFGLFSLCIGQQQDSWHSRIHTIYKPLKFTNFYWHLLLLERECKRERKDIFWEHFELCLSASYYILTGSGEFRSSKWDSHWQHREAFSPKTYWSRSCFGTK